MILDPLMFARFYVIAESRVRNAVNVALGENAYESFQAALKQQMAAAQQQAQAVAQAAAQQQAQAEAMEAQAKAQEAQAKAQKQARQPAMGEETAGSEYGL